MGAFFVVWLAYWNQYALVECVPNLKNISAEKIHLLFFVSSSGIISYFIMKLDAGYSLQLPTGVYATDVHFITVCTYSIQICAV